MPDRNRSRQLAHLIAAAVTAAALATPPAFARPIDDPKLPVRPAADPTVAPERGPARSPVVQQIDDGFDWGSAAIGAGAAGAVIVLVTLGGFAYTARHQIGVAR